jgi:hypothetical protein
MHYRNRAKAFRAEWNYMFDYLGQQSLRSVTQLVSHSQRLDDQIRIRLDNAQPTIRRVQRSKTLARYCTKSLEISRRALGR